MPYKKIESLPKGVTEHLPKHAQEIYLAAYNSAWEEYADPKKRRGGLSQEDTARMVAWAAVKNTYEKDAESGKWRKKEE